MERPTPEPGLLTLPGQEAHWRQATLWFLALTTCLRLWLLPQMELAPDEAYYWDWSRRLSLGYYDQGPMIAYVIRLTTALFGTNEFGVRVGVLLASLVTIWSCGLLATRIFSPKAGFWAVVLLGATPLMAVGSLIATYDPLLVAFWALTLVALERALFAPDPAVQRRSWGWAGLAAGCGLLSKHTMLLLLPCLLLFLLLSPAHRVWLRRPHPYLALGLMLLLYSGVIWWNSQNHWWTFGHLLFLAAKSTGSPVRRLGDFLGSQALLVGPVLFFAALAACVQGLRAASEKKATRLFLVCMGLPVLLFFCLMCVKAKVQGNWAPCAWLSLTVLWAGLLTEGRQQGKRRRSSGPLAVLTGGILTLLLLAPDLRQRLGIHLPPQADLSNTTHGWRQLAVKVQETRREMEAEGRQVFLAGNGYQYCALLAFYLPDHPETHDMFLHFRLTMYAAYVERLQTRLGWDAIFVNDGRVDDGDLRRVFTEVEWEPPYPLWRKPLYSEPIRTMHIARCRRYRYYQGLEWAIGG